MVPYMALVPAMTMTVSSSMTTTAVVLVFLALIVGIVRFPITLCATFIEVSTIRKRARLKTKVQRQLAEREYALKVRNETKLQKEKSLTEPLL